MNEGESYLVKREFLVEAGTAGVFSEKSAAIR
jgi:hypothetical protein